MRRKLMRLNAKIVILICIAISFITIGYSAINTSLTITGETSILPPGSFYITNITLIENINCTESFIPTYNGMNINLGMDIPGNEARFTYEVTIKNNTDSTYHLNKVVEKINTTGGTYYIVNLYVYDEIPPNSEVVFQIAYALDKEPLDNELVLNLDLIFGYGEIYKDPQLMGADPEIIDGLIPVVYNEETSNWEKADVLNEQWYDYGNLKWANAATVISSKRSEYYHAEPGVVIKMEDVISFMVWIPRHSYTRKDEHGYGGYGANPVNITSPGAFDIKFISEEELDVGSGTYTGDYPDNYNTSSAFCWGNTCDNPETRGDVGNIEIPGFWIAKFEATKINDILYSKPNLTPMINYSIADTFYYVQDLMNGDNGYYNYGYIGYVDAHLIKNTEWGAVAYLSQSKYGKYGNTDYLGANKEIYINNCSTYITGIGGSTPTEGSTTATCYTNTYDTYNGMGASTTGNIYGIYDMVGGTFDRVMGIILDSNGNFIADYSEFTELPDGKYINIYPYGTYTIGDISPIKGDALTETINYYSDRYLGDPRFSSTNYYLYHWIYRGGSLFFSNTDANGIFSYTLFNGQADGHHSSRFTITIY